MAQSTASEAVPGVVRVKLQREVASRISKAPLPLSNGIVTTGITPLDRVNTKVKASSMTRVIPYSPKFEDKHKAAGLDLWYEIRFDEKSGMTPAQAANLYKSVPGIQYSEKIMPIKPIGGESFRPLTMAQMAAMTAKSTATLPFNDPLLKEQWHYHNDGSMAGAVAGADINAYKAWAEETGNSDVLVAIIDGGFQTDHSDLAKNAFVNTAELNGQPGVDDDGNGYVDDIHGYNFVIMSQDINAHAHGTHVAGTVGAVNNNGVGVSGVAGGNGNGGVKMLVCQVFDDRSKSDSNFASAIIYAADMGASIAQCSWGWSTAGYYEQIVLDAIDYFTINGGGDKMDGGLCIFANGNTHDEGYYWPACYDKVVAVGAMDALKQGTGYSTRGEWCDITAPGGDMDYGQSYGVLSTLPNNTYGYNEGTSMACPHVSGIAALILSKYGSKTFTNENLRSQLVSSVNDFYSSNPGLIGKFGSGYIDAYKALQMGDGTAPNKVEAYTVTPSQDNILIEWTIPEAAEKSVDHHTIYYSTEAFTVDSDLKSLKSVTIDTKFMNSGDAMTYELKGLNSTTTYYLAIVAVNRYGQASELSEIKSATTNEGPKVTLDKTSIDLNVDATTSNIAEDSFTITNDGKGVLKYSISANTQSVYISSYANKNNVTPGKIAPASKGIVAHSVSQYPVVSEEYFADDYPKLFSYSRTNSAYIGDSDLSMPNAQAQYFYVDPEKYPNGFNLTALEFGGAYGENPVIEIYDGATTISKASLLATVNYDWFTYFWDINLNEQLFFAPGSAFWVVAKFPAGQSNPLGAGRFNYGEEYKQYSFYSNNNGETWTQLSEVLREGNLSYLADSLAWSITAKSHNPDWSSVLNPSPIEASIRPGESQIVTMTNDGQKMVNGTYTYNLTINTNESQNPKQNVTVNMNVSGNKPEITGPKMVNFGALLVGQERTYSIEVANIGYGIFGDEWGYMQGSVISSSSEHFYAEADSYEGISARSSRYVNVTFKPTAAGNLSGTITLTSKDGVTFSFIVRGVASMPAKIAVAPTSHDFGDLTVDGEEKSTTITITNEGEYPLQYVFPKFSNDAIEDMGKTHKFGYTYISNLNGSEEFAYDNNPELSDEVDITKQFNSNNWQSTAIDLGFVFPFYGTDYTKVHVTSRGNIQMHTMDGNISCMVPVSTCVSGLGYISAYANSGTLEFGATSKVSYGNHDGKFIVKFHDVLTANGEGAYVKVSYHIALCPDGSIEYHYDNYDRYSVMMGGEYIFIGVSDVDCEDPFVITDADDTNEEIYTAVMSGSAVKIVAPAKSMVQSLSSASGIINIGESQEITIYAGADANHYAGALTNYLSILTNDPITPLTNITLTANIVGENLKPVAELNVESLDFGDVFRTSTQTRNVLLSNTGSDKLNVTSVAVTNGKFTVADEIATSFVVEPGTSKSLKITLPTVEEGTVEDIVTITFADNTSLSFNVKGNVIGVPQWDVTPSSIEETVAYGTPLTKELTVSNAGNETLSFSVEPSDWISIIDQTADANSSIDYIYKSATDYDNVKCNWIDITNDPAAVHKDITYYLESTDYHKVELPFEFPFYGKMYKTMYIYNTGFVSFSEHVDYKMFPEPPAFIPTTDTFYTNIIAPYWGNHSMGAAAEDGTYYKEEDDHVIVSFINYGNSVTLGLDFQVIIYKDGHYKFQYHLQDFGQMLSVFGLAGIQDENGERGIMLPENCITPNNAVEFYPVKSFTVPAGENKNIAIDINSSQMANEYSTDLIVNTNVPTSPVVAIPVKMTVTGEPKAVFPESIGGEEVADITGMMPTLSYEFEVANEGTKAFSITGATFNPDMIIPTQLMVYTTYTDWGMTYTDWVPYANLEYIGISSLEVGDEPVKFRVDFYDYGSPMEVELPITFSLSGLPETEKIVNFKLSMTEPPVMAFDKDEIIINAFDDTFDGKANFQIQNNGTYKLTYSLRLDPNGIGEQPEEDMGGGGIAPMPMNVLATSLSDETRADVLSRHSEIVPNQVFSGPVFDVPNADVNNLLYHPTLDIDNPATYWIGTGSANDDNFMAATRYVAPAEGFNLSHLYFYGTIGDLENVDIEANVIGSSDITSTRVIGYGKLRVEKEEPLTGSYYGGMFRILEFDKPVYINPCDTFYVALKFPAGYGQSAALINKAERVDNGRYMAWLADYGWIDIAEEMYLNYSASFGYMMTCIELEAGQPWIKLLNSELEGEIAPGSTLDVNLEINAASAYFDKDNKAIVVIKSNDPLNKLVNYPVTFNQNAAPVITVPEGTTTVAEAATAEINVYVADAEGEAFTVEMTDESGIASISSPEATDGVISVAAGESLNMVITLAPDYGMAGQHSLTIIATDAKGKVSEKSIIYNVEFTNRKPVYVGESIISVGMGQTAAFSYSSLFNEPDGGEMTFSVSMPENDKAEMFTNNSGFILSGKALGQTRLTLNAADSYGATESVDVTVEVIDPSGIGYVMANGDAGNGINVYPNPVIDFTNVTLADAAENINYSIFDNSGRLILSTNVESKAAGQPHVIDMSAFDAGIYRIVVTTANGNHIASVLKK